MPIPRLNAPVHQSLLSEIAERQIRDAILHGRLAPGEVLLDQSLSAWLCVSRTPIREALSQLARIGLIETPAGRYTRVAVPRSADAIAALQALGGLYGEVARTTVPSLQAGKRAEACARIDAELARLEDDGWASALFTLDSAYEWWLRACPNPLMARIAREITYGLSFKLRVPGLEQLVPLEHLVSTLRELRAAVDAGDGRRSEEAIERLHLLDSPSVRDVARRPEDPQPSTAGGV